MSMTTTAVAASFIVLFLPDNTGGLQAKELQLSAYGSVAIGECGGSYSNNQSSEQAAKDQAFSECARDNMRNCRSTAEWEPQIPTCMAVAVRRKQDMSCPRNIAWERWGIATRGLKGLTAQQKLQEAQKAAIGLCSKNGTYFGCQVITSGCSAAQSSAPPPQTISSGQPSLNQTINYIVSNSIGGNIHHYRDFSDNHAVESASRVGNSCAISFTTKEAKGSAYRVTITEQNTWTIDFANIDSIDGGPSAFTIMAHGTEAIQRNKDTTCEGTCGLPFGPHNYSYPDVHFDTMGPNMLNAVKYLHSICSRGRSDPFSQDLTK